MVFHLAPVHGPDAGTGLYHFVGVAHAVFQCGHNGDGLEHRTGLQQVADGMVFNFAVLAVDALFHVDDGFNVARLHLHDNGHAHVTVDFAQFVDDGSLGQILHAHVYGGHNIGSSDGRCVHDVQKFIEHFPAVLDAIGAPQQRVVRKFDAAPRCAAVVHGGIHVAHGSPGQCAVGPLARVQLVAMESALELRQPEHGQLFHLGERVIVDALRPYGPVTFLFLHALGQVILESRGTLFGEDVVQSVADAVYLGMPQRVVARLV